MIEIDYLDLQYNSYRSVITAHLKERSFNLARSILRVRNIGHRDFICDRNEVEGSCANIEELGHIAY